MGSRIIVCGSVHLSEDAYAKAREIPLLELFVGDPNDPDGESFIPKGVNAKEVFSAARYEDEYRVWAQDIYDPKRERWIFGCSMHDDDWWNATHDLLPSGLANLKDRPGIDVILAYVEWSKKLDSAWKIERGRWSEVEPLPKLTDTLAEFIAGGQYENALGEIGGLLPQIVE